MVLAASTPALASSVRQVSLNEMTTVCEFIFEGRVIGHQVKTNTEEGAIRTVVTFEVLEIIKGDAVGDTVELQFLGGTHGGRTLKVTDMHLPQIGEKGIYFVESLERQYVNPLCAWDQGHFVIERELQHDTEIVKTRTRQMIYGVDTNRSTQVRGLNRGVASGVRLSPQITTEKPLGVEDFKQQLRTLLVGSQE
jgi:hypothetical protein